MLVPTFFLFQFDGCVFSLGNRSSFPCFTRAQDVGFLSEKDVKLVVVACNTASALALPEIEQTFDIPMIGVIAPGAQAAVDATKSGHIGVIGTISTISSGAYSLKIHNLNSDLTISGLACPLFVPLVEEGWTSGGVPKMIAETYLDHFKTMLIL